MFSSNPSIDVHADVLARYDQMRADYLAGKRVD